jgi:antitoxin VapB
MLTRIFQPDDSPAVYTPEEFHFANVGQDLEIERVGDTLVFQPIAQDTLANIGEIFAMFSPSFMAEGRNSDDSEEVTRHIAGRRLVDNLKNSKATDPAKELTFDDISLLIDDSINEVKG